MNAMLDSREAFTYDEELAYNSRHEVIELDLNEFKGIACSFLPVGNKVYYYNDLKFANQNGYLILDRNQLGSKSSRRFSIIKADHSQKLVGLYRTLKEVENAIWKIHFGA